MKYIFLLLVTLLFTSCYNEGREVWDGARDSTSGGNNGSQTQPGVLTAGEWNDLDNWEFWLNLMEKENIKVLPSYWEIYNNNRVSVLITNESSVPVPNTVVSLQNQNGTVYSTRTDNQGKAELWIDIFQFNSEPDLSEYTLNANFGEITISDVKLFPSGVNEITLSSPVSYENRIEVSFVVDATGSMTDEIDYLKTELLDVIDRIVSDNPNSVLLTSSVFYRDRGDEYVTRLFPFNADHSKTVEFIKAQNAAGGGDYPEAVHDALDVAVNDLSWTPDAKTKILFLILDAPPHKESNVLGSIRSSLKKASELGIKIIPVSASGIDLQTEFFLRFLAITTNGTYTFLTDHSGVGNPHLEPSVGDYQVEFLNDLMVRLVNKYAK